MAVVALQCDLLETFEEDWTGASRYVERMLYGARGVKLLWLGLFTLLLNFVS